MTLSAIDKGISEDKIKPDIALQIIAATIEESRAGGYTWEKSITPDFHSAYMKDKSAISHGDFVIKPSPESTPDQPKYDAYRLVDSANIKYLGSETDVQLLKPRVEHFAASIAVNRKINETIALSAENVKRQPEKGKGMDI